MTTKRPKVAPYIRTGQKQTEADIINSPQYKAIIKTCEEKEWDICDTYIDNGYSGLDLNRPQLQNMLEDAKSKKYDIILVTDISRLTRDASHFSQHIASILIENNIILYELCEGEISIQKMLEEIHFPELEDHIPQAEKE